MHNTTTHAPGSVPLSPAPRSRPEAQATDRVDSALKGARSAAMDWADRPLSERLRVIRRMRHLLAGRGASVAAGCGRPATQTLSAEVIPLADACRFLERRAPELLETRRLGAGGRPGWLLGHRARIERVPLGTVLIVAPSNYPLLLPGVQAVQALAAGNAVVLKPGDGGRAAAMQLAQLAGDAGLPSDVLQVLDESRETGAAAVAAGFDKIVFTGSAATGRAVLGAAADRLTPATVELSGCDAAIVLEGADLERAARAIAFGLTLNDGCTCIAPRRIVAVEAVHADLERRLQERLADREPVRLESAIRRQLEGLVADREASVGGFREGGAFAPAIYRISDDAPLARADIFAPVAGLLQVADADAAAACANLCPYGLGASVFGPEARARDIAERLRVGLVTINDIIVPSADPRLPFGGVGESGFGSTRGAEGLLQMTRPKVVTLRRGRFLPHLDPPSDSEPLLLDAMLRRAHGSTIKQRLGGLLDLLRAVRSRRKQEKDRKIS